MVANRARLAAPGAGGTGGDLAGDSADGFQAALLASAGKAVKTGLAPALRKRVARPPIEAVRLEACAVLRVFAIGRAAPRAARPIARAIAHDLSGTLAFAIARLA